MWNELQKVGIGGFLICQWGTAYTTPNGLVGPASWTKGISTSFRMSDDMAQGWDNVIRIYNEVLHIARSGIVGPHNIADMDLLEVGNAGMTHDEQASHFAIWAMLKSALMISTDIERVDSNSIAILQNKGLIAINQDPLVKPVTLVQRWTADKDLLAGDLANGDKAVLLVNLKSVSSDMGFDLSKLGLAQADILDLWTGETHTGVSSFSKHVEGHGNIALRLSNVKSDGVSLLRSWFAAENGSLGSGAQKSPCRGCSSPNKVGYIGGGSNGYVTINNIYTSRERQTVLFDYINCDLIFINSGFNERLASVSVNNGTPQVVSFVLSGYNWEADVYPNYAIELAGFRTDGPNSITISGANGGFGPDLVRIGIVD